MARKLNLDPNNIINEIIKRYNNDFDDIFTKLYEYEKVLKQQHPKHLFSVDDCKTVLEKYNPNVPWNIKDEKMEVWSECLLLLYNWQKCKIIYNINLTNYNDFSNEYVDPKTFNQFPYAGFYINYNFRNSAYYGAFVTYYKHAEDFHLQKRLLFGYTMYDADGDVWIIEPVVFDIKNNVSITESIFDTMTSVVNYNMSSISYLQELTAYSCMIAKFVSTLIEYYRLEPKAKQPHVYKKISKHNHEYNVKIELSSKINLSKTHGPYQQSNDKHIKSSPKSPHPRRAHTRDIPVKNKAGDIISYRTIEVSSSYIHEDQVKPVNIKNVDGEYPPTT